MKYIVSSIYFINNMQYIVSNIYCINNMQYIVSSIYCINNMQYKYAMYCNNAKYYKLPIATCYNFSIKSRVFLADKDLYHCESHGSKPPFISG